MTAEQFYANYEFADEKGNDSADITEDMIIEMLNAFHEYKTKCSKLKPKQFLCGNEYRNKEKRCIKQCGNCQGNV